MPFLEDFVKDKSIREGSLGVALEYEIKPLLNSRYAVYHKAGCVFIGSNNEAREYVKQQRSRQAVKMADQIIQGTNPFFRR